MDRANLSSWLVAGGLVALLAATSVVVKPDLMPRLALHDPTLRAPNDLLPATPSRVADPDLPLIEH
jgi:hypothetical protein